MKKFNFLFIIFLLILPIGSSTLYVQNHNLSLTLTIVSQNNAGIKITTNFSDNESCTLKNVTLATGVTAGTVTIYDIFDKIIASSSVSSLKAPFNLVLNDTITYKVIASSFYTDKYIVTASNPNIVDSKVVWNNGTGIDFDDSVNFYSIQKLDLNCINTTTKPMINSNFINNTEYFENQLVTIHSNYTDINLLAYNITIFNKNGNFVVINDFEDNLTGTFYEVITNYLTEYEGDYSIILESWDSHTGINIPNYDWEKYIINQNNKIYKGIKFNNIINISTDDFSKINDFYLIKKNDRYLMIFNFSETDFKFDLFLDGKNLKYLPNSKYKGHFLIGKKHWIDFESSNIKDLNIEYLSNYNIYKISFTPKNKIVIFNSIGDLNYQNVVYNFYVLNSLLETNKNITEGIAMIALIIYLIFSVCVFYANIAKFNNRGILIFTLISFIILGLMFRRIDGYDTFFYISDFFIIAHLFFMFEPMDTAEEDILTGRFD